jgi:hypothetical protein
VVGAADIRVLAGKTDQAPVVQIVQPGNGQLFPAGANIVIKTDPSAVAGRSIRQVEVFAGSALIGTATNSPFAFTWSNVPLGSYLVTAKATDSAGATDTSSPVNLIVHSATIPAQTNGLVLWLKCDETSGNVARDSSGNQNDAVFAADPPWPVGQFGNAVTFTVAVLTGFTYGNYAEIPNSPSLDISGANLTIAGWINTVAGSDAVIFDKPYNAADVANSTFTSPFYQYGLERSGRHLAFLFGDESATVVAANSTDFIQDDTWAHFALTYDGAAVSWYINGVLASSNSVTGSLQARGNRIRLGGDDHNRPQQNYAGNLDDLRLYSRTLAAPEILALTGIGVASPALSATRSGNNVTLSWGGSVSGFSLESTDSLSTPNWTVVTGVANNSIGVTIGSGNKFYRLRK